MKARLEYGRVAPGALEAMHGPEAYANQGGLECSLLELIKTRASQINGCAYCIDMHTKDARANAESEQRLYAHGARHLSSPSASARHSRGRKP